MTQISCFSHVGTMTFNTLFQPLTYQIWLYKKSIDGAAVWIFFVCEKLCDFQYVLNGWTQKKAVYL